LDRLSIRHLAKARERKAQDKKAKISANNRKYREQQKKKRDGLIADTTISGDSIITAPAILVPLESEDRSETLPIENKVVTATDSCVVTDSGVASLLTAASILTNDVGVSGASGRSIGKSNEDAICIDDDENSSDEACYIYDEVSFIALYHYSQHNKC
jgi:hypothetical protein